MTTFRPTVDTSVWMEAWQPQDLKNDLGGRGGRSSLSLLEMGERKAAMCMAG